MGAFAVLHSLVLERLGENIVKNMQKRLLSYMIQGSQIQVTRPFLTCKLQHRLVQFHKGFLASH